MQPMPTFAEKGTETIHSRLNQVRESIARFEKELVDETAAASLMADADRGDAEDNIADIQESLAHLRDEEAELMKANTDTEDDIAA